MSSTEHNRTVTGLGRRDFLIGLGLATAGTAFGLSAGCSFLQTRKTATASGAVSAAKPNILIILPDQWRRQAFSCAGDPNVRTPNLDRLAGQGMSFERSYTVCPICGPARASLLTGRYPHQTDVWSHNAPYAALRDDEICIAEVLKNDGYTTGYIGKWHLMGTHHTEGLDKKQQQFVRPEKRHGFDWFEGYEVQHTEMFGPEFMGAWYYDNEGNYVETPKDKFEATVQTDHAIQYMKEHRSGKPFCLALSLGPPHMPYTPPPAFDRFKPEMLKYRPNVPEAVRNDPNRQKELCGYYGLCEALDHEMGRLMKFLDESGLGENTIVLFTSDHGDSHGSQNQFYKGSTYEESVGVPLFVRWPGHIPANLRTDTLISSVDIMPTLLGLVGAPIPSSVSGRNLSPTLLGEAQKVKWAYLEGPGDGYRCLVTPESKLQFAKGGVYHFTDPVNDPYELKELKDAPSHAAVREQTAARLKEVAKELGDRFFEPGYQPHRPPKTAAQNAKSKKQSGSTSASGEKE